MGCVVIAVFQQESCKQTCQLYPAAKMERSRLRTSDVGFVRIVDGGGEELRHVENDEHRNVDAQTGALDRTDQALQAAGDRRLVDTREQTVGVGEAKREGHAEQEGDACDVLLRIVQREQGILRLERLLWLAVLDSFSRQSLGSLVQLFPDLGARHSSAHNDDVQQALAEAESRPAVLALYTLSDSI